MSMTDLGNYCPWAFHRIKRDLGKWQRRTQFCSELASLGDYELRDIGVSRYSANFEVSKPFWMA
jgi:uncharacterized protein YjiS (DUF1127 family)